MVDMNTTSCVHIVCVCVCVCVCEVKVATLETTLPIKFRELPNYYMYMYNYMYEVIQSLCFYVYTILLYTCSLSCTNIRNNKITMV